MSGERDPYAMGRAQQQLIIRSKPDWTREQWMRELVAMSTELMALHERTERLLARQHALVEHLRKLDAG